MYIDKLTKWQRVEVGKLLKREIDAKFAQQKEFAVKLWIQQSQLSAMFTDPNRPITILYITKIAQALALTQSQLDKIVETAIREDAIITARRAWIDTIIQPMKKFSKNEAISFLANEENISPDDVAFAIEMVKAAKMRK